MERKIDRDFCRRQVQRLTALRGFPTAQEGATELIDSLFEYAFSDSHAKMAITEIVRTSAYSPTPHDLISELLSRVPPETKCGHCSQGAVLGTDGKYQFCDCGAGWLAGHRPGAWRQLEQFNKQRERDMQERETAQKPEIPAARERVQ